jgi:hypothetical protein
MLEQIARALFVGHPTAIVPECSGPPIWDVPARSRISSHSGEVYHFTSNRDLTGIQPH